VQIFRDGGGVLHYSYPVWEQRDYKEFQNLLPIPQNDIDRNGKLDQNTGY
jgi:hypothetical protein